MIHGAVQSEDEWSRKSWNDLLETYWYPLYAFCRRQGNSHPDAQDLTQAFFTHLLTSRALENVAPSKGRFRSFLLTSLRNFIANHTRAARTIRRGGTHQFFSLYSDDLDARFESGSQCFESPEIAYEREWVATVLQRTWDKLAEDYKRAERQELFTLLAPHMMSDDKALPRLEIGERLKLSPAAIAMSIYRMRKRFGEILWNQVLFTVKDPAEAEDELKHLMAIVGRRG